MKLSTLCYISHEGRLLLLHRTKKQEDMHKGKWVGLGGKFEAGESPEDCVIREVYEESGLTIHNPQLRGILTFPNDFNQEDWYVFLFSATQFEGELIQCDEGELRWVQQSDIDFLDMHEGDRYFLKWMKTHSGLFTAKFQYDKGTLIDYQLKVY